MLWKKYEHFQFFTDKCTYCGKQTKLRIIKFLKYKYIYGYVKTFLFHVEISAKEISGLIKFILFDFFFQKCPHGRFHDSVGIYFLPIRIYMRSTKNNFLTIIWTLVKMWKMFWGDGGMEILTRNLPIFFLMDFLSCFVKGKNNFASIFLNFQKHFPQVWRDSIWVEVRDA